MVTIARGDHDGHLGADRLVGVALLGDGDVLGHHLRLVLVLR
ncbi:hypothetical protein E2C01_048074 [Portunus trituberculatus]|uniref:Uncharacterized protein n=1 Tax=Portunus trituberculatus TaxID=210409 RepID=A0A5B7G9K5_PORTR|nr:hypothetical protein [Portunus trituberculatus]